MAALTRTLAAGAVAALSIGTVGAVAAPATAGSGHGHRHSGGLSLTKSAAATLDKFDVDVAWTKSHARRGHDRSHGLRGTVIFDGVGSEDTTWSKIRVNDRTNRVTAVVNGGERKAVLKFKDARSDNDRRGHRGKTVLRLTDVGADSIDKAAGADAFDKGDAFAKTGHRHR